MMKKKTANREFPKPVMTRYGPGHLLGYDGKGQMCVSFGPGDAPELEKKHSLGGPCYTIMLSVEDIEKET